MDKKINYMKGKASEVFETISEKQKKIIEIQNEIKELQKLIPIETQKNFEEKWGLAVGDKIIISNYRGKTNEVFFYMGFNYVCYGNHAMMQISKPKKDGTASLRTQDFYSWDSENVDFKKI